jgi:hypothetical protein
MFNITPDFTVALMINPRVNLSNLNLRTEIVNILN